MVVLIGTLLTARTLNEIPRVRREWINCVKDSQPRRYVTLEQHQALEDKLPS